MQIKKFYNSKGQVAVLYSPGYGAGWSSWNGDEIRNFLLFDSRLVALHRANAGDKEVEKYLKEVFPDRHISVAGWDSLDIVWLYPGCSFKVKVHAGSERIENYGFTDYFVA